MTAASNSDARKRQQERRADAEPVERLREAARDLRAWPREPYDAPLADWLDGAATRHVPMGHPQYGVLCCLTCSLDLEDDERGHCDDLDDALAVADQILGGDS